MAEVEKKQNWFMRHKIWTAIIVVFIVISIGNSGKSSDTKSVTQPSQPAQEQPTANKPAEKPTAVPISYETVDAKSMIAEFDENQLAAEKKLIQFTAKIINISEDIMGNPFLSLAPTSASDTYFGTSIQCVFKNKEDLTTLKNGQKVTLNGEAQKQTIGIITVKNCQVVK